MHPRNCENCVMHVVGARMAPLAVELHVCLWMMTVTLAVCFASVSVHILPGCSVRRRRGRYWRGVVVFLIIGDIKPFVADPRRRCRRVTRRIRRRSHLCRRLTPSARISAPPPAASLFTATISSSQPAATQSTINCYCSVLFFSRPRSDPLATPSTHIYDFFSPYTQGDSDVISIHICASWFSPPSCG